MSNIGLSPLVVWTCHDKLAIYGGFSQALDGKEDLSLALLRNVYANNNHKRKFADTLARYIRRQDFESGSYLFSGERAVSAWRLLLLQSCTALACQTAHLST